MEMIKVYLSFAAAILLIAVVNYAACVLVTLEFNPLIWGELMRGIYLILLTSSIMAFAKTAKDGSGK